MFFQYHFWLQCVSQPEKKIHKTLLNINQQALYTVNFRQAKSVKVQSYFWSAFSCIQSKYKKIRTRNNSLIGHFSHNVRYLKSWISWISKWKNFFEKKYVFFVTYLWECGSVVNYFSCHYQSLFSSPSVHQKWGKWFWVKDSEAVNGCGLWNTCSILPRAVNSVRFQEQIVFSRMD